MTRVLQPSTDLDLLRAHLGGERDAFNQLVTRHLDMVYSAALRQVRDPHLADDVTQAVFLVLWRKAAALRDGTILPAWLHRATGYCAANALRLRAIRKRHEQRAAEMAGSEIHRWKNAAPAAADAELSDVLDRAVAKLSPADRTAVIMRFLEGRSSEDIAAALHLTPEAARKRVERAVVKLQEILSRFGVTTAAPALTAFLTSRAIVTSPPQVAASVHATIAAASAGPIGLTAGGAGSAGTAGIIAKGAIVAMSAKTQWLAVAAICLLLLIGAGATYSYMTAARPKQTLALAALPSSTSSSPSPRNTIHVQAYIDGRSRLCVSGNTVHWSSLEYDPPGKQGNAERPTLINGQKWYPAWSSLPVGTLSVSDNYKQLTPPLPRAAVTVSVNPINARGKVWVVQQPSAGNDYTLIVEFDDSAPSGAASYTVDLLISATS
jgi:RNA polymerase sigma factor (sigma-70 family)